MLHRKEDRRLILRYALPSISAMVVSCTYNVVDGIFVGQGAEKTHWPPPTSPCPLQRSRPSWRLC